MEKYISEIRKLISDGKLEKAIEKSLKIDFKDLNDIVNSLSARYKRLKSEKSKGTLSHQDESLTEQQITNTLLTFLTDIENQNEKEITINTDEAEWQRYIQLQAINQVADTGTPLSEKGVSVLHKKTLETFLQTERVQEELLVEDIEIIEGQELAALAIFDLAKNNWLIKATVLTMGERKELKELCPTAYPTKFAVYDDEKGIDLRITKELNGNLYLQYQEAMLHIRKNLYIERDLNTRTEEYEIPLKVIQELVANAFVHRDYGKTVNSFIQIEVYTNRIEIKNPGLFPQGFSLENIEQEIISSKFQNPSIAHIFYLLGVVEKLGSGIRRAQDILHEKGYKRAEFFQSEATNEVKVTIYKKNGATNGAMYVEKAAIVQIPPPHFDNLPLDKEDYLLGRKAVLAELHYNLQKENALLLINGIGGIGKTTLASFYANSSEYKAAYTHCFWIKVSDLTGKIKEAFIAAFLDDLDLYKLSEKQQLQKIISYLQSLEGQNLLIIDNANDVNDINNSLEWLRATKCKVLITTRTNINNIPSLYITNLPPNDALSLFIHYFPAAKTMPETTQLLQNIDYHTLLTEFMAKSLAQNPVLSLHDLLKITQQQDFTDELLAYTQFTSYHTYTHDNPNAQIQPAKYLLQIFPVLNLSEQEQKILRYFSILPTTWIDIHTLLQLFASDNQKRTYLQLGSVLQSLYEKGWLQKSNSNTFNCHVLLQHIIRQELKPNVENCALLLKNIYTAIYIDGYTNKLTLAPYLSLIANVLSWIKTDTKIIADIYENSATIYEAIGDYTQALNYNQENVRIKEKILAEADADLATAYNNIAITYEKLGDYPQALEYGLKALAIREKVLSLEDFDLAISYNNISSTYNQLGDYQKALEYNLQALAIRKSVLAYNHPDLALSYNNIAATYGALGDHTKELEYNLQALAIRKSVLADNHPDLALSYSNIAATYGALGDNQKRLKYDLMSLMIRKSILAANHPDLATAYDNIAITYEKLGDYPQALEYGLEALAIREKVLSVEHPQLATSYNNIAITYEKLGDYPQALKYGLKALAILEKVLSAEHPNTARTYNNIGLIYYNMGDYPQALDYYKQALSIYEKVLGKEHPDTANTYNNIGRVYSNMGDYLQALDYYKQSLAIYEKVLGKEHPDTANIYNNIGGVYNNIGNYSQSLDYYKQALDIYEKVLGKEHPNTATIYNNIASTYYYLKDYATAYSYIKKAIAIRTKVLPKEHPYIQDSLDKKVMIEKEMRGE